MAPHAYTELFFLDEAVAFAAGHRPCAECRGRTTYASAVPGGRATIWRRLEIRAVDIDRLLHRERIAGRGQKTSTAALADLPDGSFIRMADEPREAWVVAGAKILRWRHGGYDRARPRPSSAGRTADPTAERRGLQGGISPGASRKRAAADLGP